MLQCGFSPKPWALGLQLVRRGGDAVVRSHHWIGGVLDAPPKRTAGMFVVVFCVTCPNSLPIEAQNWLPCRCRCRGSDSWRRVHQVQTAFSGWVTGIPDLLMALFGTGIPGLCRRAHVREAQRQQGQGLGDVGSDRPPVISRSSRDESAARLGSRPLAAFRHAYGLAQLRTAV